MKLAHLVPLFAALFALSAHAQTAPAEKAPDLAANPAPVRGMINPALPSIFVAGDSTAAKGKGETQQGWAVPFADYFDSAKANVLNRARGGASTRTFIALGLWDQILADLKKDDVVLIQFGHNDGSPVNEAESVPVSARRSRGTIPGLGEETQEIDNIITKKHETIHTFGWYMRKMIADVQAKGAKPIVISLTARNIWSADGRIERGSGRYSQWSYDIAKAAHVPFIDLTTMMADKFDAMGAEKTKALYPQDHTHFNAVGADLHAAAVVAGLKTVQPNPISKLLSAQGEALTPAPVATAK